MMEIAHPDWPTYLLGVFWSTYDGQQKTTCREGQDLKFIKRDEANRLLIPAFLLKLWDHLIN